VPDDPAHLVTALTQRAEAHLASGDLQAAHDASSTAFTLVEQYAERCAEPQVGATAWPPHRVAAWRVRADVLVAQGRFEHAIWMRHRLVRDLSDASPAPTVERHRLLALCLAELATAHRSSGRPASAQAALQRSLHHLRSMSTDADTTTDTAVDRRVIADVEREIESIDDELDGRPRATVTSLPGPAERPPRASSGRRSTRWFRRRTR
jgi:hypothetical protein